MELDIRPVPPPKRHPMIFETFDGMEPGQAIRLINDHDPKPLHYTFMHEREGSFEWSSQESGPEKWVALIRKL
ncbi:MAG: DUF2249 domain-containing protein [Gaiellales bacterium]|nr:MAG: DUF2249 domain-containing protein [Gaiellales bacterium]